MSILNVQKVLNDETMLLAFIGLSIIVALLASATLYFAICKINPKVNTKKDIKNAAHTLNANKQEWRKKIEQVVSDYNQKKIKKDQAFAKLAQIARQYVSIISGENIKSHTLSDISSLRNSWKNTHGADLLRQTIAALYPTEFADTKYNNQAKNTDVNQGARWVLVLLESWKTKENKPKENKR